MASVTPMSDCPAVPPTAVQEPGTGQDTPNSSVSTAPSGAGTGCSRHLVPSHVCAKAPGAKSLAGQKPGPHAGDRVGSGMLRRPRGGTLSAEPAALPGLRAARTSMLATGRLT